MSTSVADRVQSEEVAASHGSEAAAASASSRLQVADRVLPIGIRAELDSVGSREKGGEAEQRVGSEEAVLAGGWRVEQQVDEWGVGGKAPPRGWSRGRKGRRLGAARAGINGLCCRQDVGVAAPGAQQPSGDARIQRLVDGFERRGYRSKVTGVALGADRQAHGRAGEGTAGADDAER